MFPEISIIVPCLNEEGNLLMLVRRIQNTFLREKIKGEVILVDDGSVDETYEVIKNLEKKDGNVLGKKHMENRGIVECWKTGLNESKGEYIVILDADLQYQPEDISRLYDEIKKNNYQIIQGFRDSEEKFAIRYLLSRILNYLLNFVFSMNLKDNKSGFIICKKEVFEDILSYRHSYNFFQNFIMVAANKKGYKIKQIPVYFSKRKKGEAFIKKLPFKFTLKTLFDFPKAVREFRK